MQHNNIHTKMMACRQLAMEQNQKLFNILVLTILVAMTVAPTALATVVRETPVMAKVMKATAPTATKETLMETATKKKRKKRKMNPVPTTFKVA